MTLLQTVFTVFVDFRLSLAITAYVTLPQQGGELGTGKEVTEVTKDPHCSSTANECVPFRARNGAHIAHGWVHTQEVIARPRF